MEISRQPLLLSSFISRRSRRGRRLRRLRREDALRHAPEAEAAAAEAGGRGLRVIGLAARRLRAEARTAQPGNFIIY